MGNRETNFKTSLPGEHRDNSIFFLSFSFSFFSPHCLALYLNSCSECLTPPLRQTPQFHVRCPDNENHNPVPQEHLWKDVLTDFHTISWTDNFLTQADFTPTRRAVLFLLHSYIFHSTSTDSRERGAESPTQIAFLMTKHSHSVQGVRQGMILWNISTIVWGKWHRTFFVRKSWVNFLGREISAQNTCWKGTTA